MADHAGGSHFASTPQASGPPQPATPASSLSSLPSPSSTYAPASLAASTVRALVQHLSTMAKPASLSEESLREHVSTLNTESLPLGPNSFIDVRDPLGKWLEAQVVRIEWTGPQRDLAHLKLYVHYLQWDDRWDEWITPINDPARIAVFKTWSDTEALSASAASAAAASGSRTVAPPWARKGEGVVAYFQGDNKKRASGWMLGRISKEDGPQMQVEMEPPLLPSYVPTVGNKGNKVQRWFHSHSDLILPLGRALALLTEQQKQQQLQRLQMEKLQRQQQTKQQQQEETSVVGAAAASPSVPAASPHVSESQHLSQPVAAASPAAAHSGGVQSPLSVYSNSNSAGGPASISLSLPISQTQFPHTAFARQSPGFLLASSPPPVSLPSLPPNSGFSQSPSPPPAVMSPMSGVSPVAAAAVTAGGGATADPAWFVGQFLEVQDSVGKFLPAEVLQVSEDGRRIYVHYSNWSAKWDEWLDVVGQAARIRALGSALEESEEEKARKAAEQSFRQRLQRETGFVVVDCDADGNCLFRAVAHQIYGSVDRHAEVRAACMDYIERNASYFRTFIADEPIEAYVSARRRDKVWGDHLELVALREMFNKQVEVFRHDAPPDAKPITIGATYPTPQGFTVPVIRLSFHGKNHYNSVVDPAHPPPLGDGHDSPVDMRQLRLRQEAAEAAEADQRAEREKRAAAAAAVPAPAPSRSSSTSPVTTPSSPGGGSSVSVGQQVVRSLSGRVNVPSPRRGLNSPPVRTPSSSSAESLPDPRSLYPESALEAEWFKLDHKHTRLIAERHVPLLIGKITDSVFDAHRALASKLGDHARLDQLERAHAQLDDGGGIESLSSHLLAAVVPVLARTVSGKVMRKISLDAFSEHLYRHTLPHISAALSN